MKTFLKSLTRRFGYEIRRISQPAPVGADAQAAQTVKESELYTRWQPPHPLYTPWVGHPAFQELYQGAAQYTIVSPERCYNLIEYARYASHLPGTIAECGVYRGGTALLLAKIAQAAHRHLRLFDSFEGLSEPSAEHDNYYQQGDFADTSLVSVQGVLRDYREYVTLHQGWIPATFAGLEGETFAFVHVDVDLYQVALDCCQFFYPRLVAGGIMLFDDYGFPACRGEKDAVDEYFVGKPERPITLQSGQGLIIKLPSGRSSSTDHA